MKYSLSFCNILQLSDSTYEVFEHEHVVIDKKCADESWEFWDGLRTEPFNLLVHCNEVPLSFRGAQEIGMHPLHRRIALYIKNPRQEQNPKFKADWPIARFARYGSAC